MKNQEKNANSSLKGKGVIYVATGEFCSREVLVSAKSLQESNPNLSITVFTDRENIDKLEESNLFNSVEEIKNPLFSYNDKLEGISSTPYEYTIFIDTDTLIWGSLVSLFKGLKYADILALQSPRQFNFEWEKTEYPSSIPQYNTGVIAYKYSKVKNLFYEWEKMRKKRPEGHDQASFREAVLTTGIGIKNIPNEYNCRLGVPQLLVGSVKIAHYGKLIQYSKKERERLYKALNSYTGVRGWIPATQCIVRKNSQKDIFKAALKTIPLFVKKGIKKL